MSAPTAETGWKKLSHTKATCTRLVAASILYKSSRLGPFTPARIRIASTTTSRTEMHSCKFAWLPPYNEMQNVPKRRQGSCTHYCGYVIVQVDSPELHAEPILNTASVQKRGTKTLQKYLQSGSRSTLAGISACRLANLRAACSLYSV